MTAGDLTKTRILDFLIETACQDWGVSDREIRYLPHRPGPNPGTTPAIHGARLQVFRAAFLAGMLPSMVARELGISVRNAAKIFEEFRGRINRQPWVAALDERRIQKAMSA